MDGKCKSKSNSVKNILIKNLKSGAHLNVTDRKFAKFQKNLMKDKGGVWNTNFTHGNSMSDIVITWSKIAESKIRYTPSYHRKKSCKISKESAERCRRSCVHVFG